MLLTKKEIKNLVQAVKMAEQNGIEKGSSEMKEIIFQYVKKTDYVPCAFIRPVMVVFCSYYYSKAGTGHNGVVNEIKKRIGEIEFTEKAQEKGIAITDFMLHKQGTTDTYDTDNKIGYEEKSGCGNWLYSEKASTLEEIRIEYERKKTLIRWDYTFVVETKKEGKKLYHVYIVTTFKRLFAFLSDFDKGFGTWWKENNKSGLYGGFCWEMQTIKTSKKKADYLLTFDEWNRTH